MSDAKLKIYKNTQRVVETLAEDFQQFMEKKGKAREKAYLALSGGSTPQQLYQYMADNYHDKIDWDNVHFFWVDERCVPPEDQESNFGAAKRLFFDHINIPSTNVHRMIGEADPEQEAARYAEEIRKYVPLKYDLPQFDWVWLGMGDDGHTASIFPDQLALMHHEEICATAIHPVSKQKRITLTGKAINHAHRVSFLVTGAGKAGMVNTVLNDNVSNHRFPAYHIKPAEGLLEWYLDEAAAAAMR